MREEWGGSGDRVRVRVRGRWPRRPEAKWSAGPAGWLAGPVGPAGGCFLFFCFNFITLIVLVL